MARVCKEIQEWIEEQVEKPIENWLNQQERRCSEQDCNWWCLCCNKWFCWLVWVVVRVITWIIVTIGKWVVRVVCEIVNILVDILSFLINLILSIPIIGGILRMILNWITEIVWRAVGLLDFVGSLLGIRPRKKMYLGAIVPAIDGVSIVSDAEIMRQVDAAVAFYDRTCNINVIFTGICHTEIAPPEGGLVVGCDAGGFFNDWWLGGSYFEFAAATCKFEDGFRQLTGLGSEIIIFIVQEVTPNKNGCSFTSTHDYVLVEAKPGDQDFVAAHEIGHACWLPHDEDNTTNLMYPATPRTNPQLTNLQISLVRWSKHVVYI